MDIGLIAVEVSRIPSTAVSGWFQILSTRPFSRPSRANRLNPTKGSWRMVQILSTKRVLAPVSRYCLNPTNGSWWMVSDPFYQAVLVAIV